MLSSSITLSNTHSIEVVWVLARARPGPFLRLTVTMMDDSMANDRLSMNTFRSFTLYLPHPAMTHIILSCSGSRTQRVLDAVVVEGPLRLQRAAAIHKLSPPQFGKICIVIAPQRLSVHRSPRQPEEIHTLAFESQWLRVFPATSTTFELVAPTVPIDIPPSTGFSPVSTSAFRPKSPTAAGLTQ
jgi:hypothetical protein